MHFVALVNVMNFKPNGLGALGEDQLAWLKDDLAGRSASQPVVVFAHMPLWTIYEPWGWGTGEGEQIAALLRRFGSVTVLNGHIHQIVQKVEGNILFHTARSTAFPQPLAGDGPGPGPMVVPAAQLPGMLGVTTVVIRKKKLSLTDATLPEIALLLLSPPPPLPPPPRGDRRLPGPLPIESVFYGACFRLIEPMPAATFRPVEPSTLSGCRATDLSSPPISTLAPRPTPTVAWAVAPAYSPSRAPGRTSEVGANTAQISLPLPV